MSRIAIIAALPGELKQLVNTGWKRLPTQKYTIKKWAGSIGDDEWIAVCAGMGADAARLAFAEAEACGKIDIVLSVGWAGALKQDDLNPGSVYIPSTVIDAQTGERFELSDVVREVLVTTANVANKAEKRRLAATYGGSLVDMESAAILRLAQMRGIPACCMKAISDDLGERLPDFNLFIDAQGQMRMLPFLGYVLVRPSYWKPLIRLGRASAKGSHTLASAILTFLNGPKDVAAVNRTGNVN